MPVIVLTPAPPPPPRPTGLRGKFILPDGLFDDSVAGSLRALSETVDMTPMVEMDQIVTLSSLRSFDDQDISMTATVEVAGFGITSVISPQPGDTTLEFIVGASYFVGSPDEGVLV